MDLTVKDAARLLQTTERALYRWIRQGNLPCHRVNEKIRLNRVELLEWAGARRLPVSPEIFRDEQPLPKALLADALRRGGVMDALDAADKRSALKMLCDQLPLPENVSRTELFNVLMARESLGSTAIGNGIAIPHPRGPIVLGVTRPTVTMALLKRPIDFGALDGRPVGVLFLTISPTIRLHLQVLSHLMYVLQDGTFRGMLAKRGQHADVLIQYVEQVERTIRVAEPRGDRA